MFSPLVGSKVLFENPEAKQYHEMGLKMELRGHFEHAHDMFRAANGVLDGLVETPPTLDTIAQTARITRDDGFTFIREAIRYDLVSLLDNGEDVMRRSAAITAPVAAGIDLGWPVNPKHQTAKFPRREVVSEHGATISLLGRVATVRSVLTNLDTRSSNNSPEAAQRRNIDQQAYGAAHDILRRGTNGYYRVNNAMGCARQERLNGRMPHTAVWVGRAAAGWVWTAFRDPHNFVAASRTFFGRLPQLRSYEAAKASVKSRP